MAATTTMAELQTISEDALAHLPAGSIREYQKGRMIYSPDHRPRSIYLVVAGNVGISHLAAGGGEILLEILRPQELFGESAFLDVPRRCERAAVLETARVMSWSMAEVAELVIQRPRLGVALLQILAQRNAEYSSRMESLVFDTIERRLARSLIRLSDRLGMPEASGSVWMMPITHKMLSRYVGTSREIISHYMSRFRGQGYLTYSREGIRLQREALGAVLGSPELSAS